MSEDQKKVESQIKQEQFKDNIELTQTVNMFLAKQRKYCSFVQKQMQ